MHTEFHTTWTLWKRSTPIFASSRTFTRSPTWPTIRKLSTLILSTRTWVTVGYQPMKVPASSLPVISKEIRQFYLSRLRYWLFVEWLRIIPDLCDVRSITERGFVTNPKRYCCYRVMYLPTPPYNQFHHMIYTRININCIVRIQMIRTHNHV